MKGRDEYEWVHLRKDLALYTSLTWAEARDLLWPLERETREGNDQVTRPYDLLQPLTVLFGAEGDRDKQGEALRKLVLRLRDERGGS